MSVPGQRAVAVPGQGAVAVESAARSTAAAHPQWVGLAGYQSCQSPPGRRAL